MIEFPSNLLAGIAIAAGCVALHLSCGEKRWVKKFTGVGFAIVWMGLSVLVLLAEGIFSLKLYHSWGFIVWWLVFLCHLGMVIIRRLRAWNLRNALFLLNHFGLWLAVAASFLGAPGEEALQMGIPFGQAEYDPWSGAVQAGILMMLAGSVGLIVCGPLKRKEDGHGLE